MYIGITPTRDLARDKADTLTGGTITATVSAPSGNKKHHAMIIYGHTDATSLIQLKDGATVIMEMKTGAGGFALEPHGVLVGSSGNTMSAVLQTVTTNGSITLVTAPLEDN